ncbi:protein-glutamate O-methyltransferase CheR [Dyella sp. 2HG41-7]|uniref:CheR family methyltransferase n=1 Tax=Dyella sp. 2HG41-7 TaxID=2883239 RepID=UPI001F26C9FE|nr:protein-glutamate O-methyltransferase CheR [Dyella sp. 2HG41-7]
MEQTVVDASELDSIEVELFVRALDKRHGYDFSQYSPASFKRRVRQLANQLECKTISGLIERVMHEPQLLPNVLETLTVPASDMFRDPTVFRALREKILPMLASYPHINIWQAGCAHGEEVYSLAILLEETGLYDRTQIFATDLSERALQKASDGIYSVQEAQQWSRNYQAAGGTRSLADYCSVGYKLLKLNHRLCRNVTFAVHNLATDGVFCEAHLILCRNVLIYFSNPLQDRALSLFRDSLVRGGFLCMGLRENMSLATAAQDFAPFMESLRIYRVASHADGGHP